LSGAFVSGPASDEGPEDGAAGEGIAGDVMLSRASGICAASGVGVEGSIGSRYGSASPYDSEEGLCDWWPDGRDLRPRRKGRRRSLMQLWCGWEEKCCFEWLTRIAGQTHAKTGTLFCMGMRATWLRLFS